MDRPGLYYQWRSVWRAICELDRTAPKRLYSLGTCGGVRLHLYGAEQIRDVMGELLEEGWEMERVRRVWPVCQQGVWVVWSDGRRERVGV